MIFTLENENYKAQIKQKGAEVCSFFNKERQIEHIWEGNPDHWNRHAPVLFPIVGQVENGTYRIENSEYKLGQHGFARDLNFEPIEQSESSIKLCLSSSKETKKAFPYEFKLYCIVSLGNDSLNVDYKIVNISNQIIFCSIGTHPGFTCPLFSGENLNDYYLKFEQPETSDRLLLNSTGLRSGERSKNYLNQDQMISLNEELFEDDALIFDDLKSKWIAIQSEKNDISVKVGYHGFPHMGIWKKPNAPFVCIEPWHGMADQQGLDCDFREKFGVFSLAPNESYNCGYSVEIEKK